MSKCILLFPGQGNLQIPSLKKLYNQLPEASLFIEQASDCIKEDFAGIIQSGDFVQTKFQQPLICILSAAYLQRVKHLSPLAVIGHSLGELSACYAAGSLSYENLIRIAYARGKLMHNIADTMQGGMLVLISRNHDELDKITNYSADYNLSVANINSDNQVVLSGLMPDLYNFQTLVKKNSYVVSRFLKVSGPWHSKYLYPITQSYNKLLNEYPINVPKIDLWLSYSMKKSDHIDEIKVNLLKQLCSTVNWLSLVRKVHSKYHPDCYIEIGLGAALKNLNKRIIPNAFVYGISDRLDEKRLNIEYKSPKEPVCL